MELALLKLIFSNWFQVSIKTKARYVNEPGFGQV
jgi:hypothetical protein